MTLSWKVYDEEMDYILVEVMLLPAAHLDLGLVMTLMEPADHDGKIMLSYDFPT